MSRMERLAEGLKLSKRLMELCDEHGWSYQEVGPNFLVPIFPLTSALPQYLEALSTADEPLGLNLHEVGEPEWCSLPLQSC